MMFVHESRYPGLNASQFRALIADEAYQDALASHGKLARIDINIARHSHAVSTSWIAQLHRSLDQPVLRPLKMFWPNGITAQWRETHSYLGNRGEMHLAVLTPTAVQAALQGVETLLMQGDTLVRRLEINLGEAKLPRKLRIIPGIKKALAGEVERGLCKADDRTATWLSEHPGRYSKPESCMET